MPVYRKPHDKNFTVIDNGYLHDKDLSIDAKGLLTLMLVLPDDWKFSHRGLEAICLEGRDAISALIRELKQKGYLRITKRRVKGSGGPFVFEYDIFEQPLNDVSCTVQNPPLTNQSSTNQSSTNQSSTFQSSTFQSSANPSAYKELT